jgi:uncharacterized delta-60 repeat protein
VLSLVLMPASPASAAAGDLDTSFGGDGIVTTDFGKGRELGIGIAIQGDDKSVVVGVVGLSRGNTRFGVARYDLAGTLDPTFGGGDGRVVTDFTPGYDEAVGVAIQDDGKIVVAGVAGKRIGVARYTATGGLDPTFGGDGKITTDLTNDGDYAYSIGIQETDDKIVVGGYAGGAGGRFAVARYETDGTLDPTFGGGDGWVATNLTPRYDYVDDLAIQADGKIVAAGAADYFSTSGRVALARYNPNGTLDTGFSGDGKIKANLGPGFDAVYAVAVQAVDQHIVAAGQAGKRLTVVRYDTAGDPDTTFSGDGVAITDFTPGLDYADEVLIQADDKIVAAGARNFNGFGTRFALVRYDSSGVLDPSFGGDGKVTTDISRWRDGAYGLGIQSDGNLVAAGYAGSPVATRFALVRYLGA